MIHEHDSWVARTRVRWFQANAVRVLGFSFHIWKHQMSGNLKKEYLYKQNGYTDSEILRWESARPRKHQPRPGSHTAAQCSRMGQAQSAEQCILNRLQRDFPGPLPLTEALPSDS